MGKHCLLDQQDHLALDLGVQTLAFCDIHGPIT
jgi:hypothetical protein